MASDSWGLGMEFAKEMVRPFCSVGGDVRSTAWSLGFRVFPLFFFGIILLQDL